MSRVSRDIAEPEAVPASLQRALAATKLILVLFVLAIPAVRTRTDVWPVVTWPMYHSRTTEVPSRARTATELQVTDREGQVHHLRPAELMPPGRYVVAEELVSRALPSPSFLVRPPTVVEDGDLAADRRSNQEHLVFLIERALGDVEVAAVEAVERTWSVDPYASPPLDRSDPVREVVTGRFVQDDPNQARTAP